MKVKVLIERLKKENPEEEVFIVINDKRTKYHKIQNTPAFYHAGPHTFLNADNEEETKSVVLIPIEVKEE
jgi:hypothetical protein